MSNANFSDLDSSDEDLPQFDDASSAYGSNKRKVGTSKGA